MSESERKSHIPDERLADLTAEKLRELEMERNELSDLLFRSVSNGMMEPEEQARLERQLENHDAATDKLTMYRAGMLDGGDTDKK